MGRFDSKAAALFIWSYSAGVFRQFMSKLILEKTKLEQLCIYIDPRTSFNEIDRYFFSGCACAYFQIAVDVYTDLRINTDEWDELVCIPHISFVTFVCIKNIIINNPSSIIIIFIVRIIIFSTLFL